MHTFDERDQNSSCPWNTGPLSSLARQNSMLLDMDIISTRLEVSLTSCSQEKMFLRDSLRSHLMWPRPFTLDNQHS
jgi:hypothetical protein